MTVTVFYDERYVAAGHEYDTTRKAAHVATAIREAAYSDGLDVVFQAPSAASVIELTNVHDPEYVMAVQTGHPRDLAGAQGFPWDPGLWTAVTVSTGGVRDAALLAYQSGGITGSLSSGLHHAARNWGRGFCTFNGLVVAADAVIAQGAQRVLIIDVDAHCGGGTASLIVDRPRVEQVDLSTNRFDRYTSTAQSRLVIVDDGDEYLERLEWLLAGVTDPTDIDLVIHNAGMDAHELDSGVEGVTAAVLWNRERMVFDWAAKHGLPVVWVLAGGYQSGGHTREDVVALHMLTVKAACETNRV